MNTKRLFYLCVGTLAIDIASCHLRLVETFLPKGCAYYLYCVAQAVTMWLLYYKISLQLTPKFVAMTIQDKYYKGTQFLLYIIVPFALKQIIDEAIFRSGQLDWADYPTLLITGLYAYHKYYHPFKLLTSFTLWMSKLKTKRGAKP